MSEFFFFYKLEANSTKWGRGRRQKRRGEEKEREEGEEVKDRSKRKKATIALILMGRIWGVTEEKVVGRQEGGMRCLHFPHPSKIE